MKKLTFILLCLVLGIGLATAQNKQVTGKVVSAEDGEPIVGVSVSVPGTTLGVVTGFEGEFKLSVPSSAKTLVFKYLGMSTQELPISPVMNVIMQPTTQNLDEVMVVAYGTTKKSSFTGSAVRIKGEKIAKMQTSNLSKSLEGAVAGVQLSSSSGQPGASASIQIRGIGSISAGKSPLIVLDGVPYEGNLNQIASQDIESMSVLKDAAANSLYGSRGANGVILITTKRGKSGKTLVTFENRTGFNTKGIPAYNVLESPQEYYELYWEAIRNQQVYGAGKSFAQAGFFASQNLISGYLGGYNNYNVPDTELIDPTTGRLNPNARLMYHENWLDEAFDAGVRQENVVTISGGTEKTSYYASAAYLYEDSYTDASNLKRINARVKVDQTVNSWFKAGFNISFANVNTNSPSVGGTELSSIFYTGQIIAPIYPVYEYDKNGNRVTDKNGNPVYDFGTNMGKRPVSSNSNAIAVQRLNIRKNTADVISAKAYAEFTFLKDFKLTVNASIDNFNSSTLIFQTPLYGDAANVNGRASKEMQRYYVLNANQLLTWSHEYGSHTVDVLLGHETKQDRISSLSAMKENFLIPDNPELVNGAKLMSGTSSAGEYALEGVFGQVKYNFDEKYYLSASLRGDASSKFHPDCRWGTFWSVGGAWRIQKESFMQDLDWLEDLKIKASFGTQGNDNLGNNQPYKDQYVVTSNDGAIGIKYAWRGNKDITWEKSNNFNVGFDFNIFNRFSGTIEYFNKVTWDLLYGKPLPISMGSPSVFYENSMRMRNNGVEFDLVYDIFNTNDFKWNVNVNLTHYKNEILELPTDRNPNGYANGEYYRRTGAPLYNWYNYKYAGVDKTNGQPLYYADVKDKEGNVIGQKTVNSTTLATRYELGKSPIPDVYGGFGTSVDFKGIDFSASFAYQIGGWVYDDMYAGFMNGGMNGQNWHKDIFQRWTPDHVDTDIPRLQQGSLDIATSSDRFLTKASYLSLRNATLGYTFPKSMLSKIGIEKLRIYAVGDNLFLASARKGFDPRQSFSGATGYSYSAMRTISFGINLNF